MRVRKSVEARMRSKVLLVGLTLAAACSGMRPSQESEPKAPVGCCCTYGDCREKFTEKDCVSEAEFQGWTYTWHPGSCTKDDTYPAVRR